MTSYLRRKRQTTRRGPTTRPRRAASLAALALLATAWPASAQQPPPLPPPPVTQTRPVKPAAPVALPTPLAPGLPGRVAPIGPAQPLNQNPVRPAALQPQPGYPGLDGGLVDPSFQIQLDPPGSERLFRLESEKDLQERIRQEKRTLEKVDKVTFPEEPVLSKQTYDPNWRAYHWPAANRMVEPHYVCHGRLLFQQVNAERYGWDLGPVHPIVAGAVFFKDVVCLPYHLGTDACRCYDCNSGYCLPGDPVPLLLYPPGLSATGGLAEAGTIALLCVIFP